MWKSGGERKEAELGAERASAGPGTWTTPRHRPLIMLTATQRTHFQHDKKRGLGTRMLSRLILAGRWLEHAYALPWRTSSLRALVLRDTQRQLDTRSLLDEHARGDKRTSSRPRLEWCCPGQERAATARARTAPSVLPASAPFRLCTRPSHPLLISVQSPDLQPPARTPEPESEPCPGRLILLPPLSVDGCVGSRSKATSSHRRKACHHASVPKGWEHGPEGGGGGWTVETEVTV